MGPVLVPVASKEQVSGSKVPVAGTSCTRLLVMLNRGLGYRTVLATATRGNGGQNEIGPEIFEALGILRTEELAAIHRFDGAEQYFTRAVDFGYSFSVDETFEKWGTSRILRDIVQVIREFRPQVMITMRADGDGGGQHHQASARLATEAFDFFEPVFFRLFFFAGI